MLHESLSKDIDFLNRDMLLLFRRKGADPSAIDRSQKASKALREKLSKIMIQRKKDVLGKDLPNKTEQVIFCDLSKLQKEVYRHVVELPDFDLIKKSSAPCDCGVNQNFFRVFSRLSTKAEQIEYYRTNKDKIKKQSRCCKKIPLNPRRFEEGEPKIDPDAVIWRTHSAHCAEDTSTEGCDRCPQCCSL